MREANVGCSLNSFGAPLMHRAGAVGNEAGGGFRGVAREAESRQSENRSKHS